MTDTKLLNRNNNCSNIYRFVFFREWNKRMSADQARMLYEKTLKQEQEFAQSFTGLWNSLFVLPCKVHLNLVS